MVRVGIRVMLGLQLVSSRFGIILCRLLYGPLYYVLVIYLHLKKPLYFYYFNMVRVRWLKNCIILVENCLHEYEIRGKKLIVRILYRSYGFCSQSLHVWSTQGWHVWAIHI